MVRYRSANCWSDDLIASNTPITNIKNLRGFVTVYFKDLFIYFQKVIREDNNITVIVTA